MVQFISSGKRKRRKGGWFNESKRHGLAARGVKSKIHNIFVPRINEWGRENIIAKKQPKYSLLKFSGKNLKTYSIGTDTYYVPKKGKKVIFDSGVMDNYRKEVAEVERNMARWAKKHAHKFSVKNDEERGFIPSGMAELHKENIERRKQYPYGDD